MSVTDGDTKESSTAVFDGDTNKDFITFEKSIGRWCRSKHGTSIGDRPLPCAPWPNFDSDFLWERAGKVQATCSCPAACL
jgi:hypothetical protein